MLIRPARCHQLTSATSYLILFVRALTGGVMVSSALNCSAGEPDSGREPGPRPAAGADSVASASSSWYRRARALDLTGDGQADSVHLDAVGSRPDSLRITLALIVGGAAKHQEEWGSSYELALLDTSLGGRPQLDSVLRARLDSVLSSVRAQRFDAPGVRLVAEDSPILAGIEPRPTHRVSFSYGYETTVRLAWDAPRERFVRLWSCC